MDVKQLSSFEKVDFFAVKPQLFFKERRDTKFLFHDEDLADIIEALKANYCVVVHQGKIRQTYSTVYFDSPDLRFYLSHHNGHGNRVKMRTRTYEDGSSFFEIKQKTNTGTTLKERYPHAVDHVNGLVQQLEVEYDRITLYDKSFQEKLTFDFNLTFRDAKSQLGFSSIVIAESKKMKNTQSKFVDELKKRKISSSSISKYCLGMVSLKPSIKHNNFKNLVYKINKLKNKYEHTTDYQ
jgi:hypothetical protein